MLKEYAIADILECGRPYVPYYAGIFENMEDPAIEWPHRHSFYSMLWFTEGSGTYVVDFDEFAIVPNRLFFMSPRQVHNWEYSDNAKGLIVMWDEALEGELDVQIDSSCLDVPQSRCMLLGFLLKNLVEEAIICDKTSADNVKLGIQYVSAFIKRNALASGAACFNSKGLMPQLKDAVFADRCANASIEQIAEYLGVPMQELNNVCRESTGYTAKQYMLNLKITEAKRLLLYSDLNINEITYSLGFDDASYFARIFKKKVSFTPSDFQKKYRK